MAKRKTRWVKNCGLVVRTSGKTTIILDQLREMQNRLAILEQHGPKEIQQGDADSLPAMFAPRVLSNEQRSMLTVIERRKWAVYYDIHGCVSCRKKKQPHSGNGLCSTCRIKIQARLKVIIAELEEERLLHS